MIAPLQLEQWLKLTQKSGDVASMVARHPEVIGPSFFKLPQREEDRSIFARFMGVPIGFQFGTAAGFDGIPALALDIITDPITYLGGFGALNKLGQAGKAVRPFMKTSVARKAGMTLEQLTAQGLSSAEVAHEVQKGLRFGARMDTRDLHAMEQVLRVAGDTNQAETSIVNLQKMAVGRSAAARGKDLPEIAKPLQYDRALDVLRRDGIEGAQAHVQKELLLRGKLAERARALKAANANPREFDKIVKEILRLDPSARTHQLFSPEARRNFKALIKASRGTERVRPLSRTDTIAKARGEPGRNLLTFRIPFTDIEQTLVTGAPFLKGAAKALKKAKGIPLDKPFPASKTAGLIKDVRTARQRSIKTLGQVRSATSAQTVYETMTAAAQAIKSVNPADEKFGSLVDTMWTEVTRSQQIASVAGVEVKVHMQSLGMDNEKGWRLLEDLISNKYGPGEAVPAIVRRGRWGATHVPGELTPAMKKDGVTQELLDMAEGVNAALRDSRQILADEDAVEAFTKFYFPRRVARIIKKEEFRKRMDKAYPRDTASTFYKHAKKRTLRGLPGLEKLRQMEKDGIIELEKDPAKILQAYFSEAGRSVAYKRMANRIWSVYDDIEVTQGLGKVEMAGHPKGAPVLLRMSIPPSQKKGFKDIADLYRESHDPALLEATRRVGGSQAHGRHRVFVLKKYETPLTALFGGSSTANKLTGNRVFRAAETMNAIMKRGLLFWTAFHHMALTESAVADMGWQFLRRSPHIVKQLFTGSMVGVPYRGLGHLEDMTNQALRKTFHEASDIVEEGIKAGLQLGAIGDPMIGVFNRAMKKASHGMRPVSPAIDTIARITMIHDKKLWDYYHNSLKIMAYNEMALRGYLKHPKLAPNLVREAAAEHVNNAFGGQAWERFWVGRTGQRWSRIWLLSPDWTSSQLKVAQDVYANFFKKHEMGRQVMSLGGRFPISGADVLKADPRATFSRQYALRAGLIFVVAANMANFAFTGHFMDENPEGHRSQVMLPTSDEKGRGQFIRFGKQFREPFDWMHEPIWTLRKKMGPAPSAAITQITGRDIFGRPIITTKDGPAHNLAKRVGSVVGGALPIPLQELAAKYAPEEAGVLGVRRSKHRAPFAALLGTMGLPVRTEFKQGPDTAADIAMKGPSIPDEYDRLLNDRIYREPLDNLLKQQAVVPPEALLPVAR